MKRGFLFNLQFIAQQKIQAITDTPEAAWTEAIGLLRLFTRVRSIPIGIIKLALLLGMMMECAVKADPVIFCLFCGCFSQLFQVP